jgi:hypothetical protein
MFIRTSSTYFQYNRLKLLNAHDAMFLLKNRFSIPKLLYLLRCAACYNSQLISEYDDVIRGTLNSILNIDMSDVIWKQATLLVSSGGLGVQMAFALAFPAFMSSVHVEQNLPCDFYRVVCMWCPPPSTRLTLQPA